MAKNIRLYLLCLILVSHAFGGEPAPELGETVSVAPNPTDSRAQRYPAIAYDSLSKIFLVVWQQGEDYLDQDSADLYAARLDSSGKLLDQTPIILCNAPGTQETPVVSCENGCFLVVWHDLRNKTDWDVYGARVGADGVVREANGFPIGGGAGSQSCPAIAPSDSGFLVVWQGVDSIGFYRVHAADVGVDGSLHPYGELRFGGEPLFGGQMALARIDTLWFLTWYDEKSFVIGGPSLRKFARMVKEGGNIKILDTQQGPAGAGSAGLFGRAGSLVFGGDRQESIICATLDDVGHSGLQVAHAVIFNKDSLKAIFNPNGDNHAASSYDNERIILLFAPEIDFVLPVAAAYGQGRYLAVARKLTDYNKLYAQRLHTDGTKLDSSGLWPVVHSGAYPVSRPALCSDGKKFVLVFQQDAGMGAQTILSKVITLPPDTNKPFVKRASPVSATAVQVVFSEKVDKASAENLSNYLLTPSITVLSASLQSDGKTVLLSTTPLSESAVYSLSVSGVKDAADIPNIMADGIVALSYVAPYNRPVFHWKLDETAGTTASDASGNGNTAILHGDPVWTEGRKNNALLFDGVDDYLSTTIRQNNPSVFTLAFWFKTTSTHGGKFIAFPNSQTGVSTSFDREVMINDSGRITFWVYNEGPKRAASSAVYNDGNWHHVAAAIGDSGMVLYVDGVLVGSDTTRKPEAFLGYWKIGYNQRSTSWQQYVTTLYFDGLLDEIRIYDYVLSAEEIALLMKNADDTSNIDIEITAGPDHTPRLEAYPNPFNPSVTFSVSGCSPENNGRISVYDLSGKLIDALSIKGDGRVEWKASATSSGIYLARLSVNGKRLEKKLIFLR